MVKYWNIWNIHLVTLVQCIKTTTRLSRSWLSDAYNSNEISLSIRHSILDEPDHSTSFASFFVTSKTSQKISIQYSVCFWLFFYSGVKYTTQCFSFNFRRMENNIGCQYFSYRDTCFSFFQTQNQQKDDIYYFERKRFFFAK